MALINGREYEFADLALLLGGVDITGFRGISYTEKIDKEPLYGKGRYAHSIQRGNYSVEGSIKILQSEYETLIAGSPRRSVLDLVVDAVVSYGGNMEEGAGTITNDVITGMQFTEAPKSLDQGDKFMEIELPFIALRIINQA
jgi:hypothetical protein